MKRKNAVIAICAAVLLAAVAIGNTLAYFSDEAEKVNQFSTAKGVDIDLTEDGWDPDKEPGKDLSPSKTIPKDPTIIGLEDDAYVRIVVTVVDQNEGPGQGSPITDAARLNLIMSMLVYRDPLPAGRVHATELAAMPRINEAAFVLDAARSGNGVYYYNYTANNGIFRKGDAATLFSGVVVPYNWANGEMKLLGSFNLSIKAQGIQAANEFRNGTIDPYDAMGEVFTP